MWSPQADKITVALQDGQRKLLPKWSGQIQKATLAVLKVERTGLAGVTV
jgi:hypothetical protein